jgi:hypothetical protein
VGTLDSGSDFFVLLPSDAPPLREDRPPAAWSLARLAVTMAITTLLLVAVAWAIGFILKLQLDHYFKPGG